MKKTDKKSGLLCVEVVATIDVKQSVKIGKGGGGGVEYINSETQILRFRIFVTIILLGVLLLNLVLVFLVSRLLSFWL
jgi:hypothetical protein